MAANPINVVTTLYAVQYDGTNSSDIIALDPGFTFNNSTENSGVWAFQSPPDSTSYTFHTGDWILFAQNQVMQAKTNAEFLREYTCNAVCTDIPA